MSVRWVILVFIGIATAIDCLAFAMLPSKLVFFGSASLLVLACDLSTSLSRSVHGFSMPFRRSVLAALAGAVSFAVLVGGAGIVVLEMQRFRWFASSVPLHIAVIVASLAGASAILAVLTRPAALRAQHGLEAAMAVTAGASFLGPWALNIAELSDLGTARTPGLVVLLLWHVPFSVLCALRLRRGTDIRPRRQVLPGANVPQQIVPIRQPPH
jgi:hypothetical protein